jgi:copper(I)-binding protein
MICRRIAVALVLGALAGPAGAEDFRLGDIVVGSPWARATAANAKTGAAYMTVANTGNTEDRLVNAASPVAERVELHTHAMDGDIMRMRRIAALEVHPGEPAIFQPGGHHVMLFGLKAPLREGQSFPLTLVFERAGSLEVRVAVQRAGAAAPKEHAPGHGGHGHRHGS